MKTIEQIQELQEQYGLTNVQNMVFSGQCWKFEGSIGRTIMDLLTAGVLFLGTKVTYDFYGNIIPPRGMLDEGTKGTLKNAEKFWDKVEDCDFEYLDFINEYQDFMNSGIKANPDISV